MTQLQENLDVTLKKINRSILNEDFWGTRNQQVSGKAQSNFEQQVLKKLPEQLDYA